MNHALRLGKTMGFNSPDGAPHAASFWCLDRILVEIGDTAIRLRFIGYHDVAAYDAGKEPVAGAVKEYLVSGTAFAEAIQLSTLAAGVPISAEILRLAWVAAGQVHDVDVAGQMVSFFDGAADAV